jgi:hypothetical protein
MNKRIAGFFFVGICTVLAILLLAQFINPTVGGILFALSLVALGIFSQGFKRE